MCFNPTKFIFTEKLYNFLVQQKKILETLILLFKYNNGFFLKKFLLL